MSKKVLIIAYYWPPAGGPGVQRWLKFVKYLPEYQIDPIVYIPENPSYPITDESLIDEIPHQVTIIKQPITEPYKWAHLFSKQKTRTISKGLISQQKKQSLLEKILLFIRGNFFIPDARVGWVKPSIAFLKDYVKENQIETVITTGPPHSVHLIGLGLKNSLPIRWLADFRDPWTTIGYHKALKLTKTSQLKHEALEHEVLSSADAIVVTSEVTKREFKKKTSKPIAVITNGYDTNHVLVSELDIGFTMSHIGSFLSERNPEVLWRVLSDILSENSDLAKDFKFNLVGYVSEEVIKSIEKYNLSNYVNKVGYVTHNKAIEYQKKSQVLLLVEIDSKETQCIIPGKLFEYMISNRPILALGPEGSDVERILKETNTGQYFGYYDYNALKHVILDHYKSYKEGTLQSHGIGLQKYSRKALTKTLSELL